MYYVDDEYYARHDCFDVAEAVVARLPEDPAIEPERWQQWGRQLSTILEAACQEKGDWRHFLDGIREYPLTSMLAEHRNALLRGLEQEDAPAPRVLVQKVRQTAKMTCVFADVHGNFPALERVLKEARKHGADSYLFLGDIVSYGPFPHQCIELLANMEDIIYLRGNHDHTVGTGIPENGSNRIAKEVDMWTCQQLSQRERDWLLSLPVEYSEHHWLVVHGAPLDPQRFYGYIYEMTYKENFSYLEQHQFSVCFYGHTHVQFVHRRFANGTDEKFSPLQLELFRVGERLLLNPGSVGQPRDGDPRAAFALWNREHNIVNFYRIPYPVDITVRALKKEGLPEDLVYRLEVGR
jgi:predicted phosphodiesterase